MRLSYRAEAPCPSESRFLARLRRHTQRLQLSNESDAVVLDVEIQSGAAGFIGRLEVTRPGAAGGHRELSDADCTEVVWALALSAALSIDPEATLDVSRASADEASPSSNGTAKPTSPAEAGVAAATRAAPAPVSSQTRPERETRAGSVSERSHAFMIGPLALTSFVFQPAAALGVGVLGAVKDTRERALLPLEFALELDYLTTRLTADDEPVVLDLALARLRYCPVRAAGGFTWLLCGGFVGGALRAEGRNLDAAEQVLHSYLAVSAGLMARIDWGSRVAVLGLADAEAPLVSRAFAVEPGPEVVSSSRRLGASVTLGAVFGF